MGTGGTISGVGRYLKEQNPEVQVIGADPAGSVYSGGTGRPYLVEGVGEDFWPETYDRTVADRVIEVSDADSFAFTRRLAREEAMLVGGSSGMAAYAAKQREVAGGVKPDVGDRALGPRDALGHGRLGDEVGRRDLTGGEATHGPQGQRDRRRGAEGRMGAQEVEAQGVVGVLGRALGRLEVELGLPRRPGRLRPGRVEEPPPGSGHQPRLRVPRRVVRPGRPGRDERLLHGVLGRREVRSAPDEDTGHLGGEAAQERLIHRGSRRPGRRT